MLFPFEIVMAMWQEIAMSGSKLCTLSVFVLWEFDLHHGILCN